MHAALRPPATLAAPVTGGTATSIFLTGGRSAPARARQAVHDAVGGELPPEPRKQLAVLVSELVTNSVQHAGAGPDDEIRIELLLEPEVLRVSVIDPGSDTLPLMREPSLEPPGGVGLFLVDQTSERWAVNMWPGERTEVWFELRPERPAAADEAA